MPYEEGMSISYDEKSGQLTVYFRGERKELGRFMSYAEALKAGEAYCRKHGWHG
jgi:hypothetical protein